MTETGELTRDDLVIDPDMEIDDDGSIVTAYVETWFDRPTGRRLRWRARRWR